MTVKCIETLPKNAVHQYGNPEGTSYFIIVQERLKLGLQILIQEFWSDLDPVFEIRSDPVFKIWSDPYYKHFYVEGNK